MERIRAGIVAIVSEIQVDGTSGETLRIELAADGTLTTTLRGADSDASEGILAITAASVEGVANFDAGSATGSAASCDEAWPPGSPINLDVLWCAVVPGCGDVAAGLGGFVASVSLPTAHDRLLVATAPTGRATKLTIVHADTSASIVAHLQTLTSTRLAVQPDDATGSISKLFDALAGSIARAAEDAAGATLLPQDAAPAQADDEEEFCRPLEVEHGAATLNLNRRACATWHDSVVLQIIIDASSVELSLPASHDWLIGRMALLDETGGLAILVGHIGSRSYAVYDVHSSAVDQLVVSERARAAGVADMLNAVFGTGEQPETPVAHRTMRSSPDNASPRRLGVIRGDLLLIARSHDQLRRLPALEHEREPAHVGVELARRPAARRSAPVRANQLNRELIDG